MQRLVRVQARLRACAVQRGLRQGSSETIKQIYCLPTAACQLLVQLVLLVEILTFEQSVMA